MALSRSETINLVQLAMKRVNVVPYEENQVAFGTNTAAVEISDSAATICECYTNVPNDGRTCHIGFSAVLSEAVASEFYVCVDDVDRPKKYANSNETMQFLDFFVLSTGLHYISIKAEAESLVSIEPREARLGVFL